MGPGSTLGTCEPKSRFPLPIGRYPFRDFDKVVPVILAVVGFSLPIGGETLSGFSVTKGEDGDYKFPLPIGRNPFWDWQAGFLKFNSYHGSHCLSAGIPFGTFLILITKEGIKCVPIAYRQVSLLRHMTPRKKITYIHKFPLPIGRYPFWD